MELMVVVTIVGIIAAFAIPNYSKAVERSRMKTALNNLACMASAEAGYVLQNNQYFGSSDITIINASLGLNIISNGVAYGCLGDPSGYICWATWGGGSGMYSVLPYILPIERYMVLVTNTSTIPRCYSCP